MERLVNVLFLVSLALTVFDIALFVIVHYTSRRDKALLNILTQLVENYSSDLELRRSELDIKNVELSVRRDSYSVSRSLATSLGGICRQLEARNDGTSGGTKETKARRKPTTKKKVEEPKPAVEVVGAEPQPADSASDSEQ